MTRRGFFKALGFAIAAPVVAKVMPKPLVVEVPRRSAMSHGDSMWRASLPCNATPLSAKTVGEALSQAGYCDGKYGVIKELTPAINEAFRKGMFVTPVVVDL